VTDIDRRPTPAVHLPDRVGQATAVEQSRAVAQVQASAYLAKQFPRDRAQVFQEMRESCQSLALAQRAFYRYSRGGAAVSGPSVHLARELARCWHNLDYGIAEMRRDDEHGQSEMLAFAWDMESNTRVAHTFIVPHKRDKKGGPEPLTDLRDIYESNANNGARRVREAIFAILPPAFVEEAKDLCAKALAAGDGTPLVKRVAEAVKAFDGIGVSVDRLEQKLGRDSARWDEQDVAQLAVTFQSLQRREITIDEEFPTQRVTAAEITGGTAAAAPLIEPTGPPEELASPAGDEWPQVAQPGSGARKPRQS